MGIRTADTGRGRLMAALAFGAALPALAAAQTTTTTSTTLATSTTSTSSTSTTSTTLPGACAPEVSFDSLECRVDALRVRLAGADDLGRTKPTLRKQADKLERLLGEAEAASTAGNARQARTKLKKAGRVLVSMGFRVRSNSGRKNISDATRSELTATVATFKNDLKTLRGTL
ncbi:MAG: hypothetical protein KIT14_16680 [bacterium]|nr:hypothetical protein [bacterium]